MNYIYIYIYYIYIYKKYIYNFQIVMNNDGYWNLIGEESDCLHIQVYRNESKYA